MLVVAGLQVNQSQVKYFQTCKFLPAGFKYNLAPVPVGTNTNPNPHPIGFLHAGTRVISTRCHP